MLERFGATIIETPVPPDVKRLGDEAVVAYQDLLAQQTAALEDKAVESYAATLDRGAEEPHLQRVDEEDAGVPQPLPPEGVPGPQGAKAGHRR